MNPNASLKSRKVNFLRMASRSFASLQPASLASAVLRASPLSFFAIVCNLVCVTLHVVLCVILYEALALTSAAASAPVIVPLAKPSTRKARTQTLPKLYCLGHRLRGSHALVPEYRYDRRHRRACAHHIPAIPGLDFRRRLCVGRARRGVDRPPVHGAAVHVRAGARVRPHLHGTRLRG